MKLLVPQGLAAAIIGRGGSVIREMQQQCQARVILAETLELLGRADCRLVTVRAELGESLNQVAAQILDILTEVAGRAPSDALCSPGHEGQLKLCALMPRALLPVFKGPSGADIRQLCETTGAMIKVQDHAAGGNPESVIELQLRGTSQALGLVVREVNSLVQASLGEQWFAAWAAFGTGPPGAPRAAASGQSRPRVADGPVFNAADNGRGDEAGAAPKCAIKLLVPQALAAIIIGHGGAAIVEMQRTCQARLLLSQPGELFPRTECRVLLARADTEEALNEVGRQVVAQLSDLADREPSDSISYEGQLKLSALVPRAAVAALIGRRGVSIRQLCEDSGADVKVREVPGSTSAGSVQKVDCRGSPGALEHVLREINRQLQVLVGEPWYPAWAASPLGPTGAGRSAEKAWAPAAEKGSAARAGMELIGRVMDGLPPYVMEESRGFAMTCVVPNRLVGLVMGRGGMGIQEVQSTTQTRIALREIPGDADNRSMNIAGPLLNACSAYMLMMKRYLDAEKLEAT